MIAVADTLATIAGNRYQSLTPGERVEVELILTAAADYRAGTVTLTAFANLGGIRPAPKARASSSFGRFVALMSTPTTDERRDALRRAVNDLIRWEGFEVTTAGVWSREDLAAGGMVVHRAKEADPWNESAA